MAVAVVMPKLGWTMEVGSLVEWLKKDGDDVRAGDILFTVESDKAVSEVEALEDGVLRIPAGAPQIGEQVAVGTVLAYLVAPGEPVPSGTGRGAPPATADAALAASSQSLATGTSVDSGGERSGAPASSPRARRVAGELGVEWIALKGSGRSGRIIERDVRSASAATQSHS